MATYTFRYPKDEIRCSVRGERFQLGDHVWTRNDHKTLGFQVPLTIRRAKRDHRCRDCYETIHKGEILEINADDLDIEKDRLEYPHPMVRDRIPAECIKRI